MTRPKNWDTVRRSVAALRDGEKDSDAVLDALADKVCEAIGVESASMIDAAFDALNAPDLVEPYLTRVIKSEPTLILPAPSRDEVAACILRKREEEQGRMLRGAELMMINEEVRAMDEVARLAYRGHTVAKTATATASTPAPSVSSPRKLTDPRPNDTREVAKLRLQLAEYDAIKAAGMSLNANQLISKGFIESALQARTPAVDPVAQLEAQRTIDDLDAVKAIRGEKYVESTRDMLSRGFAESTLSGRS